MRTHTYLLRGSRSDSIDDASPVFPFFAPPLLSFPQHATRWLPVRLMVSMGRVVDRSDGVEILASGTEAGSTSWAMRRMRPHQQGGVRPHPSHQFAKAQPVNQIDQSIDRSIHPSHSCCCCCSGSIDRCVQGGLSCVGASCCCRAGGGRYHARLLC